MSYTGHKPALHAALTTLAQALDPWHGHPAWIAENPADPWSAGHWDSDPAGWTAEGSEQRAERIGAAVAAFRVGLDQLADVDDDALRIRDELLEEDRYAAAPKAIGRRTPEYGQIVHSAIARLDADANPPQTGEDATWCRTCRKRRVVVDVDNRCSAYVGSHEVEWTATHLACGHTLTGPERIIGRSPGGEAAAEAIAGAATQRRLEHTAAMQDDA